MIDKLELRVPESVPRRTANWREYPVRRAKRGSPYAQTLDADRLALRIHYDFGVPVAKEKRHWKLDFTPTRLFTAEDLLSRLTWLFKMTREQALSVQIARIDFAADVNGVTVEWFRRHSRVKRKRKSQSYEVCKAESSKGSVTSVVFGKRTDLYRIYDRVAEKQARGADVLYAGMLSGDPVPTITRVERQCSGRSIPKDLLTLGGLFEHAAETDPFPNLVCRKTDAEYVSTEEWRPQQWLMSVGLATVVKQLGEATVRARLNRKGNAKRVFSKYSGLLRDGSPGVTKDRLREIYRITTIKQLNLPTTGPDGEISYPAGGVVYLL
jgi:hypothetical protein